MRLDVEIMTIECTVESTRSDYNCQRKYIVQEYRGINNTPSLVSKILKASKVSEHLPIFISNIDYSSGKLAARDILIT